MAFSIVTLVLCALAGARVAAARKADVALAQSLGHERLSAMLEAHAVLGALAWVVIIPLGAILFRALRGVPGLFWMHAVVQSVGLLCLIPSFGLGVVIGLAYGKLYDNPHTVLGTVVLALALLQPAWGAVQHRAFVRSGRKTWWGVAHRWLGRITVTAAIINGGLGFILTKGYPSYSRGGLIAYIIVSVVMWSAFVVAASFDTLKGVMRGDVLRKNSQRTGSVNSAEENQFREMMGRKE